MQTPSQSEQLTDADRLVVGPGPAAAEVLSPIEAAAWERVHAWQTKYYAQHRRMPRHNLVMKRLKHERARGASC